jgi:uncharacterized RDD family membrane protein YckC
MRCPKCHCEDTSPSGMCLWCGYQVYPLSTESKSAPKESAPPPDNAATEESPAPAEAAPEMPRQDADVLKTPPSSNPEILSSDDSEIQAPKFYQNQTAASGSADVSQSRESFDGNGRWMFILSRTLAGMMDMVIMILITVLLLVLANFFSGFNLLDFAGILHFFSLLLLVYFLYSFFFLGISGRTIGMMAVNLRVVTQRGGNPGAFRILGRCFGYLVSTLFMGIGLIWAFFDSDGLCVHDRLTNTRVVRTHHSHRTTH